MEKFTVPLSGGLEGGGGASHRRRWRLLKRRRPAAAAAGGARKPKTAPPTRRTAAAAAAALLTTAALLMLSSAAPHHSWRLAAAVGGSPLAWLLRPAAAGPVNNPQLAPPTPAPANNSSRLVRRAIVPSVEEAMAAAFRSEGVTAAAQVVAPGQPISYEAAAALAAVGIPLVRVADMADAHEFIAMLSQRRGGGDDSGCRDSSRGAAGGGPCPSSTALLRHPHSLWGGRRGFELKHPSHPPPSQQPPMLTRAALLLVVHEEGGRRPPQQLEVFEALRRRAALHVVVRAVAPADSLAPFMWAVATYPSANSTWDSSGIGTRRDAWFKDNLAQSNEREGGAGKHALAKGSGASSGINSGCGGSDPVAEQRRSEEVEIDLRAALSDILQRNGVSSLLDASLAPTGWMLDLVTKSEAGNPAFRFYGAYLDCRMTQQLSRRWARSAARRFGCLDFGQEALPKGYDLVFVGGLLEWHTRHDVWQLLNNVRNSGARYLLVSSSLGAAAPSSDDGPSTNTAATAAAAATVRCNPTGNDTTGAQQPSSAGGEGSTKAAPAPPPLSLLDPPFSVRSPVQAVFALGGASGAGRGAGRLVLLDATKMEWSDPLEGLEV